MYVRSSRVLVCGFTISLLFEIDPSLCLLHVYTLTRDEDIVCALDILCYEGAQPPRRGEEGRKGETV